MIQSRGGGTFTTADAAANLAGKTSRALAAFDNIEVRLLRTFPAAKKGEVVLLCPVPNGRLHLVKGLVGCFCEDGQEGVDFEFID